MSIWIAGRAHFPEQNRRVDGHWQLSKAGTAKARRGSQIAEADISSDPADDGDTRPKEGKVKDVQTVLSHSRAATTTDVYRHEIPESVRATVNAINAELKKKAKSSRKQQTSRDLLPNATKPEEARQPSRKRFCARLNCRLPTGAGMIAKLLKSSP